MKLLALSGSTRRDSWNTRLLHAAAAAAPARAEVAWAPDLSALPHFGEDIEAQAFASGPVAAFVAAVHAADALLVATPEYNQSIPGTLKNVAVLVSVATIDPSRAHQGMSLPARTYPTRSG